MIKGVPRKNRRKYSDAMSFLPRYQSQSNSTSKVKNNSGCYSQLVFASLRRVKVFDHVKCYGINQSRSTRAVEDPITGQSDAVPCGCLDLCVLEPIYDPYDKQKPLDHLIILETSYDIQR